MKQLSIEDVENALTFTLYDNSGDSILRGFTGFEFANINVVVEDSAKNGASFANSKFSKRDISMTGDLVASDVFGQRRDLLAALRQTGYLKLLKFTTYDDLLLQCYADIVKVVCPYNHSVHTFLIEAICPDWRFYSQTLHATTITSDTTIVNAGNELTEPTIVINGPGTGFTITNVTTGESFYIDDTLVAGQTIEIDMTENTVLLNGTSNIYDKFSGDFFSLAPGNNEISIAVGSGSTSATNLIISWRDAYRGV